MTLTLDVPGHDFNWSGTLQTIYLDTYFVFIRCLVSQICHFLKFQCVIIALPLIIEQVGDEEDSGKNYYNIQDDMADDDDDEDNDDSEDAVMIWHSINKH